MPWRWGFEHINWIICRGVFEVNWIQWLDSNSGVWGNAEFNLRCHYSQVYSDQEFLYLLVTHFIFRIISTSMSRHVFTICHKQTKAFTSTISSLPTIIHFCETTSDHMNLVFYAFYFTTDDLTLVNSVSIAINYNWFKLWLRYHLRINILTR